MQALSISVHVYNVYVVKYTKSALSYRCCLWNGTSPHLFFSIQLSNGLCKGFVSSPKKNEETWQPHYFNWEVLNLDSPYTKFCIRWRTPSIFGTVLECVNMSLGHYIPIFVKFAICKIILKVAGFQLDIFNCQTWNEFNVWYSFIHKLCVLMHSLDH